MRMFPRLAALLSIAVLTALAAPLGAQAAESRPNVTKRATVTLVSDTDAITPGAPYQLGLRFQMAEGWHTYGRNPGDAGVAPELAWTLPPGTTAGEIAWPTPQRMPEGPLMTFGYTGTAMLVIPASGPGPVRLHASWLICNNICVPEEADFNLDLPQGTAAPSAQAPLFASAEAARPRPSPFLAHIAPDATLVIGGPGFVPGSIRDAFFFPDQPERVVPTGKQVLGRSGSEITLSLTPGEVFKASEALSGVLVLSDSAGQQTALSITATPGAAPPSGSLWQVLGAALLGGLILNLMPCVFPILAMKAMAIARLSAEARPVARAHAAGYTAGILTSFAAIGGAVLLLRTLGHEVGWGFQFQSPLFVAGICWVLFAVGLNLSGVFDIGGRAAGIGQSLTLRGGFTGSFFSGVLAVLVATPCTAPFMSVALAAALTAPPFETVAVFLALGLGLAAPTVALTLMPGVARMLPRPGPWMDVLKQALAFPTYAACVWLIWVISLQAGSDGVLATGGGLVLVGFAAWAWRFATRGGRILAVCAVLALPLVLTVISPAPSSTESSANRFTTQRLAELRASGRPVFVNITAAWCVTCLVNERVALSPADVQKALAAADVTVLTGDWTRQDSDISAFLASQGRDGVPLYLFYPAGGRPPVSLPQILTPGMVREAISAPLRS
jgi:thiol:disulfide interchange protein DsbD